MKNVIILVQNDRSDNLHDFQKSKYDSINRRISDE